MANKVPFSTKVPTRKKSPMTSALASMAKKLAAAQKKKDALDKKKKK